MDATTTANLPPRIAKVVESALNKAERAKEHVAEMKAKVIRTTEVSVGAAGSAFLQGRYPDKKVMGLEPTLATAIGCYALTMLGAVDSATEEHLQNIGDGSLCAYWAIEAAQYGAKKLAEAQAAK